MGEMIEPIEIGKCYGIHGRSVVVEEITDLFVYFEDAVDFNSGCLSVEEFARLTTAERMQKWLAVNVRSRQNHDFED